MIFVNSTKFLKNVGLYKQSKENKALNFQPKLRAVLFMELSEYFIKNVYRTKHK